jgi:hypothetical protein
MKTVVQWSLALVAFFTAPSFPASAQGTFQNLNFEQANPVVVVGSLYYPYGVTAASALPDWTVSYGTVQQTQITENDPSAGSTWVVLIGPGSSGVAPGSYYPLAAIDGNYSVLLQGGVTASAASISQTGLIPASTQSLLFEADAGSGPLDISIGGQNIPFAAVGTGPNYTLYSANISAWAGDTAQLTFSALEPTSGPGLNNWLIDDITFAAVPEPNILALTTIGGLLFGARQWFARRR